LARRASAFSRQAAASCGKLVAAAGAVVLVVLAFVELVGAGPLGAGALAALVLAAGAWLPAAVVLAGAGALAGAIGGLLAAREQ
jgi:hypothetical protein